MTYICFRRREDTDEHRRIVGLPIGIEIVEIDHVDFLLGEMDERDEDGEKRKTQILRFCEPDIWFAHVYRQVPKYSDARARLSRSSTTPLDSLNFLASE